MLIEVEWKSILCISDYSNNTNLTKISALVSLNQMIVDIYHDYCMAAS